MFRSLRYGPELSLGTRLIFFFHFGHANWKRYQTSDKCILSKRTSVDVRPVVEAVLIKGQKDEVIVTTVHNICSLPDVHLYAPSQWWAIEAWNSVSLYRTGSRLQCMTLTGLIVAVDTFTIRLGDFCPGVALPKEERVPFGRSMFPWGECLRLILQGLRQRSAVIAKSLDATGF